MNMTRRGMVLPWGSNEIGGLAGGSRENNLREWVLLMFGGRCWRGFEVWGVRTVSVKSPFNIELSGSMFTSCS